MSSSLLESAADLASVDAVLARWSQQRGGREQHWPVLMEESTLRQAGYPDAFPHLLMTACAATDPESSPNTLSPTGWCLSPAVCYHAYAALEGSIIHGGLRLAAKGHCFRNEATDALQPGRRQIEFQMRELVLIGDKEWLEQELSHVQAEIGDLAGGFGISGSWEIANDPFFLPRAKGKAQMQRLMETKREYCLPDGLAIASINRHGPFFGERFHLSLSNGQAAHSACIAFGLERWATHATKPSES